MNYRIKEFRLKNKLTQEELAHNSGINRTTIVQLENGEEVNVTAKTLRKLAKCLNVSVKELFD